MRGAEHPQLGRAGCRSPTWPRAPLPRARRAGEPGAVSCPGRGVRTVSGLATWCLTRVSIRARGRAAAAMSGGIPPPGSSSRHEPQDHPRARRVGAPARVPQPGRPGHVRLQAEAAGHRQLHVGAGAVPGPGDGDPQPRQESGLAAIPATITSSMCRSGGLSLLTPAACQRAQARGQPGQLLPRRGCRARQPGEDVPPAAGRYRVIACSRSAADPGDCRAARACRQGGRPPRAAAVQPAGAIRGSQ